MNLLETFATKPLDLFVLSGILPARICRNDPNIWRCRMTDKPMNCVGSMVPALLNGKKTQTRRVITKAAAHDALDESGEHFLAQGKNRRLLPINVVPGDRLWVREAWQTMALWGRSQQLVPGPSARVMYMADHPADEQRYWAVTGEPVIYEDYRQPRFMPRWASRLTLTVTDVRVQRLQDISEPDAVAEGYLMNAEGSVDCSSARDWYAEFWNSINAKRGFGWEANPRVAAYSFTVSNLNIDQMELGTKPRMRRRQKS